MTELFEPVPNTPDLPDLEAEILRLWHDRDVPRRSVDRHAPSGEFVFYEGPPTANGKPGIHHVSVRAVKDLFLRYKTMRGYRAARRSGWDTHGLPVEVEIEKEIGSRGKQDVEAFGVAEFNRLCRESVFRYIQDWDALTERIGFWLDRDGYITYKNTYIESIWWILKSFWEREILYQSYKTTMHCPRCNTTLASHEVSQGMTEGVDDPSAWVSFTVRENDRATFTLPPGYDGPISLLIWTTTPWTLPANAAIAANPNAEYALILGPSRAGDPSSPDRCSIVAVDRVGDVFGEDAWEQVATMPAAALKGVRYEPLFHAHLEDGVDDRSGANAWRVILDNAASVEDGTGLVHIAPAYGDFDLGERHQLPILWSINPLGRFFDDVRLVLEGTTLDLAGSWFKDADDRIVAALDAAGHVYRSGRVNHTYPLCWRDDTPLLHLVKNSWYLRTTAVREQLVTVNRDQIHWVPDSIGAGRFGNWLEHNVDWAISRERYWGTPLPIWVAEDGDARCIGSIAELADLCGRDLSEIDLHRPDIDEVTFVDQGKTWRRVPYTVDVWFDSGAMPIAQWHYPFENEDAFERSFPADFICEAIDQTRGWFYSLHAIATLLTDAGDLCAGRKPGALHPLTGVAPAFRVCVVTGFINDAQGRKMSKSRGNTVDPWSVLDRWGADALRWYLYSSGPVEQNKNFDVAAVQLAARSYLGTLWSCYSFFVTYARIDRPDLSVAPTAHDRPEVDRWLLAELTRTITTVTAALDAFDGPTAARALAGFVINDLSNWYLRINRRRFWKSVNDPDKASAYATVFEALTAICRATAPFTPFIAEAMWENLRAARPEWPDSVHLAGWPDPPRMRDADDIVVAMAAVRAVTELGRSARAAARIRTRQPLERLLVQAPNGYSEAAIKRFSALLAAELNVKSVDIVPRDSTMVHYRLRPNYAVLGPRLGERMGAFRSALDIADHDRLARVLHGGGSVTIPVAGIDEPVAIDDVRIDVIGPDGYMIMAEEGWLTALPTEVSEELRREGWVRDVVRLIQQARKEAGFDLIDRITVGIESDAQINEAISAAVDYVSAEVLAADVWLRPLRTHDGTVNGRVDGHSVIITVARADTSG